MGEMDIPKAKARPTDELELEVPYSCFNSFSFVERSMEAADDMKGYWRNIRTAVDTLKTGLKVTAKHMKDARTQRTAIVPEADNYFEKQNAIFTVQYPKEKLPVPDHGRYKLHNEIDDCIVCDKCAKVCPVDCIDIIPLRAVEEIGKTSDGTPRRIYAEKFNIDMAKCCFCGLCTTVCPTECLTMTDEYDFSAYDFEEHNVPFANMTPLEILQKKKELEEFNKQKEAAKALKREEVVPEEKAASGAKPKVGAAKPAFKPRVPGAKPKVVGKPQIPAKKEGEEPSGEESQSKPKPVFKPRVPGAKPKVVVKPKMSPGKPAEEESGQESKSKPKPVVRPKVQPKKQESEESNETSGNAPRPVIKPKVPGAKPKVVVKPKVPTKKVAEEPKEQEAKSKPRPVMKPKVQQKKDEANQSESKMELPKKAARPVIKPKIKPKNTDSDKEE